MSNRVWTIIDAMGRPFSDPASRTWWGALAVAGLLAIVVELRRGGTASAALREGLGFGGWRSPSQVLDLQLLVARQLIGLLRLVPAVGGGLWLATHLVRWLDATLGVPTAPALPSWSISAIYAVTLFTLWDLSRFVVHRLLHRVELLWQFHQVHHSATVMTPLTFHRVHPVESLLYQARGVLVTAVVAGGFYWVFRRGAVDVTLLGVHALGLLANVVSGNLRHSQVWLSFGRMERWFISPAQHQLHHSADPAEHDTNYGTWLAGWDRAMGSWRPATTRPERFGLPDGTRNHRDTLVSAWFGPFAACLGRAPMLLLLLMALPAIAQESPPPVAEPAPPVEYDDASLEVIVESEGGVPRAAGSAHVVSEEELERYEYDDIHKVLGQIPGVYVRGEDGFGLRPNIGIRGANSDRSAKITLMEDGVLLTPAPYAAPAAYYFPMTTRVVGVEVFKGPAATRHGPHTVGGAINLITRPVPREGAAGALDVAWGLRNTAKAHGWAGTGTDRAGVLGEVVHLTTGGFKHLDDDAPTGFDHTEVMLKGRVATDPARTVQHGLELKLGYGRELSHETYLGLSIDDVEADPYRRYAASANGLMRWHRSQVHLAWDARFGPDLELRTVAYHQFLTRQWTKLNRFAGGPELHDLLALQGADSGQAAVFLAVLRGEEDSAGAEQVLQIGTNDRRFHSFGVQSRLRWRTTRGIVASQLEAGLRVHGDDVRRIHTEDPHEMRGGALVQSGGEVSSLLDSSASAVAVAVHLHEDLGIGAFRLIPGIRAEIIRTAREDAGTDPLDPQFRVVPLPGVGVFGSATPWLSLFAGVHRGFSPVGPGQPADVKPETSWNVEAGARVTPGELRGEVVGFFNDYVNLTGQCTFSGGCSDQLLDQQFNGGKVWVYGLEAGAGYGWRLPRHWTLDLDATYTLTDSRFRTGFVSGFPQFGTVEVGDELPYVPRHQGSAQLVLTGHPLTLSLGATARSGMRDAAGQAPLDQVLSAPARFLLDVAVHVDVTAHVEAYVTVNNATASSVVESWRPFGARPTAPIQAMFGIKLR